MQHQCSLSFIRTNGVSFTVQIASGVSLLPRRGSCSLPIYATSLMECSLRRHTYRTRNTCLYNRRISLNHTAGKGSPGRRIGGVPGPETRRNYTFLFLRSILRSKPLDILLYCNPYKPFYCTCHKKYAWEFPGTYPADGAHIYHTLGRFYETPHDSLCIKLFHRMTSHIEGIGFSCNFDNLYNVYHINFVGFSRSRVIGYSTFSLHTYGILCNHIRKTCKALDKHLGYNYNLWLYF